MFNGKTMEIMKHVLLNYLRSPEIINKMINAIYCLHNVNFYHCDIKPANFLITVDRDGRYMVYIIDFGGMSVFESELTDDDTMLRVR